MDLGSKLGLYDKKPSQAKSRANHDAKSENRQDSSIPGESSRTGSPIGESPKAASHCLSPGQSQSESESLLQTEPCRQPQVQSETESPSEANQGNQPLLQFQDIQLELLCPDLYFRRIDYPDLLLGQTSLAELLVQPMQYLDDLLPSRTLEGAPEMVHRNEVLFIDTETTGLGRGPGNFPFLYGLAYISENGLVFEQYFLNGPGAEAEFQAILREKVSHFAAICSYNGKSFDVPLIRNRFVLLGERFKAPPVHLDLFHFWRSIGGGMRKAASGPVEGKKKARLSMKGFKQKNMEEEVLGFFRQNDLPGAEVPQVYFDFRKYGRGERMSEVLRHNEWDLQGLALLFLKAISLVNNERDQVALYRSGIARMFLRHGKSQESARILRELSQVTDRDYQDSLLYGDRILLGNVLKRNKRYVEADEVFEGLFRKYRCMQSCIEMSRYREFRLRELDSALEVAQEGLELLEFRGVDESNRYFQDLKRRTTRLRTRMEKQQRDTKSKVSTENSK